MLRVITSLMAGRPRTRQAEKVSNADIDHLDEYLEMMYSDAIEEKVSAAVNILSLCQYAEYLETMLNHGQF
jgi:hypothetical protein